MDICIEKFENIFCKDRFEILEHDINFTSNEKIYVQVYDFKHNTNFSIYFKLKVEHYVIEKLSGLIHFDNDLMTRLNSIIIHLNYLYRINKNN